MARKPVQQPRPRPTRTLAAPPAVRPFEKEPFDIHEALRRVRQAVTPFRKAAMFELAEEGYDSPFEQLVACIISIRTRDETTAPTAKRLFAVARTPAQVGELDHRRIDALIRDCTFHKAKAVQILQIARRCVHEFAGKLPCDFETLTSFHGVGPKCANLTLGIACSDAASPGASPGVGVDIHVHRVTNRWGYVAAASPERTMRALHDTLPREYWVAINALLVPFGKHICRGARPKCSTCPMLSMCRPVGVTARR